MILTLAIFIFHENERPTALSEQWTGAYSSLDGTERLYINELDYIIEEKGGKKTAISKIVNGKQNLFKIENRSQKSIIKLEHYGNYIHFSNLSTNTWKAYKKLNLY